MVSEIQTIRKLNKFTVLLLLDSTCLNDSIVIKIKNPFTLSFFFKKPFFIFVSMMISVQIWQSKLQYAPYLKCLVQLLYVFLTFM